jgi:MFS family permease
MFDHLTTRANLSVRYGNAVAMALENCPTEARGLMSGILQQGYSMGYVFAACANLGVGGAVNTWKTVFWIAAGLSIGVGILRCFFPESAQFLEAQERKKQGVVGPSFWKETKVMLAQQWKMCVYCIILMTWFNCTYAEWRSGLVQVLRILQITVIHRKTATRPLCSRKRVSAMQEQVVHRFL